MLVAARHAQVCVQVVVGHSSHVGGHVGGLAGPMLVGIRVRLDMIHQGVGRDACDEGQGALEGGITEDEYALAESP